MKKEITNRLLSEAKEKTEKIFKASEDARPMVYFDRFGKKSMQCPGSYSSEMTLRMKSDMLTLGLLISNKSGSGRELIEISEKIKDRDLILRRMFDDLNDHRPLCEYPHKDTGEIVKSLTGISEEDILNEKGFREYKNRFKLWIEQVIKLDIFAYYCHSKELLRQVVNTASTRLYDSEGNMIEGVIEKEEESIKTIASMEHILLKSLIRIPAGFDELGECLDKIESLDLIIQMILSKDTDRLNKLIPMV